MRSLRFRIERLDQHTVANQQTTAWVFVLQAGASFALDLDRCAEVLTDCGLAVDAGISHLNFLHVPHGLSAEGLAKYLREHRSEVCNPVSCLLRTPGPKSRAIR